MLCTEIVSDKYSEQFLYITCSPHFLRKEELLTKIYLYSFGWKRLPNDDITLISQTRSTDDGTPSILETILPPGIESRFYQESF